MKKRNTLLLSIGVSLLLMLTACNQNAAEPQNNQGENRTNIQQTGNENGQGTTNFQVDNQDRGDRARNRSNIQQVGYGNLHTTNTSSRGNITVPTDGLQNVNNGFLTIDQNSYSTTISSDKFPHSKYVRKGQFKFYKQRQQAAQGGNQAQKPATEQQQPAGQSPAQETAPEQNASKQAITATESRVIELTNAERRKNGLPNLQSDTALSNVAREKSNDMRSKNYFSHTSPTYGSPFDMMRDFGISYKSAGENIAQGQQTPEQVVDAWMKSEGHRKNILNKDYTHIGVGHAASGNYWTQMFIRK